MNRAKVLRDREEGSIENEMSKKLIEVSDMLELKTR